MMNRKNLALLLAALVVSACTNKEVEPAASEVALDSMEQRLNYGIAYEFGSRLKEDGFPLDADTFSLGLRHALEGTERLVSQEQVGEDMQAFQDVANAKRAEEMVAIAEENAAMGSALLAENATAEGIVVTESGLQYKVLAAGDGPKPGPDDVVEVNYRGTLVDGTEFDSSYARNSPISFGVGQVIAGWTEGLQLMPVGSKYQFVIPPELAYGSEGAGPVIGPNSTLIFEVELLSITAPE